MDRQLDYLPTMPLVPGTGTGTGTGTGIGIGIGIGLVPLLQWVVLALLTVWFVRRQLGYRAAT